MRNFIAHNPTKLHFGKGVVSELGASAAALGKHALLVYGADQYFGTEVMQTPWNSLYHRDLK